MSNNLFFIYSLLPVTAHTFYTDSSCQQDVRENGQK